MENFKVRNYEFKKSENYVLKNGKLFEKWRGGLRQEKIRCMRNVNSYKIFAHHENYALPVTTYYVGDTKDGSVYVSDECYYSIIDDIVEYLSGI